MKSTFWLPVLICALVLCLGLSLLTVSRINDARSHVGQAGPGAFNYFLQSNRNIDMYVEALRAYKDQQNDSEAQRDLRNSYIQRFDVVWGGFTVFDVNFRFRPEQQQQVSELLEYATDYLTSNESLMEPDYVVSDAEIDTLIHDANTIKEKVDGVGHQYFIYAIHLVDVWNEKMRSLYQSFWICVVLMVLTGGLLFIMLMRSFKRSADLIEKSRKTQQDMKQLIDALRSGKLENKAKDNFIAAASHDLRQPLHALGLFLGATEKHIENDAGRQALAEAKHCTAELNRLFNSLLDLSRLDAGVVAANITQFNLDRLLHLMEQEFSALATQAGIDFDVYRDIQYVQSDALLLNRILRNLLENAFTHSDATEVKILCERQDHTVRLTVFDNGTGIPVAEQSDIFAEYYQLDNPERDRSKGLGLGLSIVKRLCEILGVSVTLESGPGKGTMFHLDVPAGKAKSTVQSEPVVAQVISRGVPENTLVAVIDDDESVRRGMQAILESLNMKAVAAESAIEMIRVLRMRGMIPDIVIADYRLLANQTGDMAIRQVRREFGMDIPAMIITGDTSPGRMSEAANSGFELMHKPVEPEELVKRVSRLLHTGSNSMASVN